ncbi:MAG TPA: hypothetical protein VFF27_10855 [Bacteroidia bacterium]|jgi:hypothetical protein|nr:hypothetical protein [Bacteroidia bacterium]
MENSGGLFALIKSLNKSEKGYFKKYANFHVRNNEQNNYTKIFDAIDLQKIYNEPKLIKKFKDERFINQFAVAKNYLYNMILSSLEAYTKTVTIELRSLMNRVELLSEKGLYTQARKVLKKAKKVAFENEKLSYLSEINLLEQNILRFEYDAKGLKENAQNLTQEIQDVAFQIDNVAIYEQLKSQLFIQYTENGNLRSERDIKDFEWLIKNPLMQDECQALSFSAKILFLELHTMYYSYIGNSKKCYEYSLRLLHLIESNPTVIEVGGSFPTQYLYRHSIHCSNAGRYTEAIDAINRLELLEPKTDIQKATLALKVLNAKVAVYLRMGRIQEAMDLIPQIKELFENSKQVDSFLKEATYWQVISLYIITEQYKLALNWYVKATLEERFHRQDLECLGRIIEIILHFELQNIDILEYRVKAAHRFMLSKDKLYPLENAFLTSFRHIIKNTDDKGFQLFCEEIKLFLQSETTIPLENNYLVYTIIVSWLESKVRGEKMEEVIRSKFEPEHKNPPITHRKNELSLQKE